MLDNLSNLAGLGDDNSAGQMQSFNMIVTKARKVGCSLMIVHHTGKTLNLGPDGVPTWRGSYVWPQGWIRRSVFILVHLPWMGM